MRGSLRRQVQAAEGSRINDDAAHGNFPMHVWAEAASCIATQPDNLTLQHKLAGYDKTRGQVRVAAVQPFAVIDDDDTIGVLDRRDHLAHHARERRQTGSGDYDFLVGVGIAAAGAGAAGSGSMEWNDRRAYGQVPSAWRR